LKQDNIWANQTIVMFHYHHQLSSLSYFVSCSYCFQGSDGWENDVKSL